MTSGFPSPHPNRISTQNHQPSLDSYKEKSYQLRIKQYEEILTDNQAEIEKYIEQINVIET